MKMKRPVFGFKRRALSVCVGGPRSKVSSHLDFGLQALDRYLKAAPIKSRNKG